MKHAKVLSGIAALAAISVGNPAAASTVIDFEDQPDGYQSNPLAIGGVSFSTSGQGLFITNFGGGTVGKAICATQTGVACEAILDVSFFNPVSGLSFNYGGVDSAQASIVATLTFFGGSSSAFTFTPIVNGGIVNFVGQSNITGLSLRTTDRAGLVYDNFTFSTGGQAVPEPATWAMMLLGFGLAGGAIRAAKRRQKTVLSYS